MPQPPAQRYSRARGGFFPPTVSDVVEVAPQISPPGSVVTRLHPSRASLVIAFYPDRQCNTC